VHVVSQRASILRKAPSPALIPNTYSAVATIQILLLGMASSSSDKAAAAVVATFGCAAEAAMQNELNEVVRKLKANPAMLWTISGVLSNPSLLNLLDGSLANMSAGDTAAAPKVRLLRSTTKFWKHLKSQPTVIGDALKACAGDAYCDGLFVTEVNAPLPNLLPLLIYSNNGGSDFLWLNPHIPKSVPVCTSGPAGVGWVLCI
jgi:hypothetical protein